MPLLHPSGGLVYHLRAWRYSGSLWTGFHAQVRQWLATWQPAETHLVLVGPSGGYALEGAFLNRFDRITALEPDALARPTLRRRFPSQNFRFDPGMDLAREHGFRHLVDRYPDAAFLFCNLLGQQLVGQPADFDRQAWLSGLAPALSGRSWASWHDLATAHRRPDSTQVLQLGRGESLDAVLARYWQGGELAIHDHACAGLMPQAPRQYAIWELRPGQYHLVEWLAFT